MTKRPNLRFKALPANSPSLFPEDILGKIPESHPVRLINQVVDQLNIDHLISEYKGGGASSYHPRMLVKVLFYSYLSNVYSCRKIEKVLSENIHFMWLSGQSTPDFRTINYFRGKRLKAHIQQLFADVVRLLQELGYVSLEVQYVDGTKIESVANRYSFVWKRSVEKNKAGLEMKIQSVLDEIEGHIKTDQEESRPAGIPQPVDSQALQEKLAELNSKLKESNKATEKQLRQLQQEHLPRLEKYEQQLQRLGDRNSYSKTDPDASFMRLKDDHLKKGQLKPGYNVQISTENQFVTHYSLHQTAGDTTTLQAHLQGFQQHYQTQSKEVVADAGYGSEENYEWMESAGIQAYVKHNYFHYHQRRKQKQNPFLAENLRYHSEGDYYLCPAGQPMDNTGLSTRVTANGYQQAYSRYEARQCKGCPLKAMCHQMDGNRVIEVNHRLNQLREQANQLLNSPEGKAHRSKRPVEVEAVFGQVKSNNRFTRFTFRGLEKVGLEFGLMAIAHNLRKMISRASKQSNNRKDTGLAATFKQPFYPSYRFQRLNTAAA